MELSAIAVTLTLSDRHGSTTNRWDRIPWFSSIPHSHLRRNEIFV